MRRLIASRPFPRPRRASRRRATALGLAAATAGLACLALATGGGTTRAQSDLQEAYELVDTWDGAGRQSAPGAVLAPAGLEVTASELYLVDQGNDRVSVYDHSGRYLRGWGRRGEGPDEMRDPQAIAVAGERVYVTDRGNGRVLVFDPQGKPQAAWPVPGDAGPWGLAVAGTRVYVSLPEAGQVLLLENGAELGRWEVGGSPHGLDLGPDGRLHLADPEASEVRSYTPAGVLVDRLSQPNRNLAPWDLDVDETGDRYVQARTAILWYPAGEIASRVAMYRDDLRGVAVLARKGVFATVASDARAWHGVAVYGWRPRDGYAVAEWPLLGFPPGRFKAPHAIQAGRDGHIWVLDAWPRLQWFDPEGRPLGQRTPNLTPQRAFEPVDLVAAASGELLVGEPGWILRLAPGGAVIGAQRLRRGTTSYWLTALVDHPAHERLTMLDSNGRSARVYGVTQTLQPASSWPMAPGEPGWSFYSDLAAPWDAGPSGRLYVVDRGGQAILVYEAETRVARWPIEGIPIRAATGPAGDLFVLAADGVVSKYRPDGSLVAAWDAGAFSAEASELVDLTVDAAGRVYTVDKAAETIRVWAHDPALEPEPPLVRRGACRLRGDKRASPGSIVLGGAVTVTLDIGGDCPNSVPGADILLAIDRSSSMNAGHKITDTVAAALGFVDAVDLAQDRLGLVSFSSDASLDQPLTADRAAMRQAVAGIRALGGTNIAAAIRLAVAELAGPRARPGVKPVLILLTDGKDDQPELVLQEAAAARARGVRVFTIGFGETDPMVMIRAASSPEDSYHAPDGPRLAEIYAEIARRLTASVLARRMTLVDRLPDDMRFEGSVAGPAPAVSGQTLTWDLRDLPLGGLRLAYRLRPQRLGLRPTNLEALAEFSDGLDRPGRLRFPVPEVEVLGLPPTPTLSPTPFPSPTPRPTATPEPLPPEPVYLPVTLNQRCEDQVVLADVVLAMDTSGSMQLPAYEGGPTRLVAAVGAAHSFVDLLLALPGNRAAVLSFNQAATLVQPLTGDGPALRAALDGLATLQGTRLDLALDTATAELVGPNADPAHNKVIVLLTDGRADQPELVLPAAERARAQGIQIFAIGLGADEEVDFALLLDLAGDPSRFFRAPSTADLRAIFERIAYTLRCVNLSWP